jgi:hypothetical protein
LDFWRFAQSSIVVENSSCRGKRNFKFAANYLIFEPVCEFGLIGISANKRENTLFAN